MNPRKRDNTNLPIKQDTSATSAGLPSKRQELHSRQRQATERRVLDAAIEVFSEKGYAPTTVNDIVVRSGVSRGAFYLYYQNKNEIFRRLVEEAVKDCYDIAVPAKELGLRERVRQSTRAHLEQFWRHRGVLRCLFEVSGVEPELGDLHNQYRAQFVYRIERHLTHGLASGVCRTMDTRVAAYCVACMVGGVSYMWVCAGFEPWEQKQRMEAIVDQITEFWCRTLYVDA